MGYTTSSFTIIPTRRDLKMKKIKKQTAKLLDLNCNRKRPKTIIRSLLELMLS